MRNRAKCKKCLDVIESFFDGDYVGCKCGEIAISSQNRCYATTWTNFLRVDDEGNEIIPKITDIKEVSDDDQEPINTPTRPSKSDQIKMLDKMIEDIEKLPSHAMSSPINHYDFVSFALLLRSILAADCKDDT